MRCPRIALLLLLPAAVRADPGADAQRELRSFFAVLADEDFGKLATALEDARRDALAILFDDARYPVPASAHTGFRVGIDTQRGHREMEQAVSAAVCLHNRVMKRLADALKVKTRTVGLKRPTTEPAKVTRAVNYYGITVIDVGLASLLRRYKKPYDVWRKSREREANALLEAVGALAAADWTAARSSGGTLRGAGGVAWEALRAAAVLSWNEKKGARHSANEKEGVRVINAYRVALGLAPLILDARLQYMARDFALEMKQKRFFSHTHPYDRTRRTSQHRASRAGYRGAVGENVSSLGDAAKAVWHWRADAGHHRVMVQPFFRAAGLGCAGRTVLNVGNTTERKILALYGAGRPAESATGR